MIQPVAYRKPLEGKSNAHLITFNDGRDYVVKYYQQGFEKSLPNEWIAYCLARFLGLPIPFAQIVQIPLEFSSQVPELAHISHSTHQFASLYIPNCLNGHEVSVIPRILNHQSLTGIILLDYWLCNKDRTRKNILLHEEASDSFRLWIIDHAEIFGSYNWVASDLTALGANPIKSATHQLIASFIKDEESFAEQLELIQTIPDLLLEEFVMLMPDDWTISADEKKAVVETLVKRRKKTLPLLMDKFIKKVYRPLKENQQ